MWKAFLAVLLMLFAAAPAVASVPEQPLTPPPSRTIKVAFVVSDRSTLIDIAGPMQTFNQVQVPKGGFETFTVSETRKPTNAYGLTIIPDYTFDNVPDADIVVVGAQTGRDEHYLGYLRRMAKDGKLMLSICTGASKFAQAGLLDGLDATTHHDFVDTFQKLYPKVHWHRDLPYVHSAPRTYTAGGETSGFELALHIVELYYGRDVALKTARSMEYRGPAWQK